jgi:hypothetical protein
VSTLDTTAAASHEIAEHVLWLAQTVELQPAGERMAAAPGGGEALLVNVVAGRCAPLLDKLRLALEGGPAIADRFGVHAPPDAPGEVWLHIPTFSTACEHAAPRAAVREMCESFALRPAEQHKVGPTRTWWRILDRARVVAGVRATE